MRIYGAGLAGLIAGCAFQNAEILEAGPSDQANHKAVLRFRSTTVGDSVGVDFRRVRVNKGIYFEGRCSAPTIQLANWYSRKVIGQLADRSIWNLDPVDRFIAPEDFIGILADRCANRIVWNHAVGAEELLSYDAPAVSTIPMSVMAKMTGRHGAPEFNFAPIAVRRWRVPNADVFQTVYFPSPETNLYRASITGDLLIAEYVDVVDDYKPFAAFGITDRECIPLEVSRQRFGKISPVDDGWRKAFMFDLTTKHKIYSLGRFGTWRNILLDDVVKDVSVLKKLMNTNTYELSRFCARK